MRSFPNDSFHYWQMVSNRSKSKTLRLRKFMIMDVTLFQPFLSCWQLQLQLNLDTILSYCIHSLSYPWWHSIVPTGCVMSPTPWSLERLTSRKHSGPWSWFIPSQLCTDSGSGRRVSFQFLAPKSNLFTSLLSVLMDHWFDPSSKMVKWLFWDHQLHWKLLVSTSHEGLPSSSHWFLLDSSWSWHTFVTSRDFSTFPWPFSHSSLASPLPS